MTNTFKDKDNVDTPAFTFNPDLGRKSAALTRSVNLSNEDFAAVGALTETAPASDTASSGLNGRLQRIAQRFTSLIALFPTSLGTKTAANSLAVTLASDGALTTVAGTTTDATVASGAGGTLASYLRTIKDAILDTVTPSPVSVRQPCDVITFTPTLDTSAYASGDVLFATAAISGATRANDERALLQSLTVSDKSDQKPAFTIYFFKTNVTSGAFNAAPTISDADGITCLGYHSVAAADWKDLGGVDVVSYKNIGLLLEAASGTTTVYAFAVLDAGAPTFANGDLVFQLGVVHS
jgi:hypothetical protein